jgi:hypothetical protein
MENGKKPLSKEEKEEPDRDEYPASVFKPLLLKQLLPEYQQKVQDWYHVVKRDESLNSWNENFQQILSRFHIFIQISQFLF